MEHPVYFITLQTMVRIYCAQWKFVLWVDWQLELWAYIFFWGTTFASGLVGNLSDRELSVFLKKSFIIVCETSRFLIMARLYVRVVKVYALITLSSLKVIKFLWRWTIVWNVSNLLNFSLFHLLQIGIHFVKFSALSGYNLFALSMNDKQIHWKSIGILVSFHFESFYR